jgi:UDP:flavonoid glycosyltransferase YjiC (YdhE family)
VVTCLPQAVHITPVLPLAEALAAQGDEVVVASGPEAQDSVEARGLAFRPVVPGFGQWFESLRLRTRGTPGDGLAPERVETYFIPRLFGEIGTALMVDGLAEACRDLSPDVLVFDPFAFAAPLVGQLLGIPVVQHSIGPFSDAPVLDLVADAVSPIWREFGLDVPPAAGIYEGTTLAVCPPSLDPAAASVDGVQRLRPVAPALPPEAAPALPFELPRPGDPLVYLTLGTFSNAPAQFRLLLDALAGEAVNVVATVGRDNDPADLAPWPANAVLERFIPQRDVLPHCAAAVHHAGAGTAFGILAHGLPSVALPQSADNFRIGQRLADAGAARTLMPDAAIPAAVGAALQDVMAEPRYAQAARGLAAEIAAMPSAAEVARGLRSLAPPPAS